MDGSGDESFSMSPFSSITASSSEEEYDTQAKLLQEFAEISTIAKAWTFASSNGITTSFTSCPIKVEGEEIRKTCSKS